MNCHYCDKQAITVSSEHHWRCIPCKVEYRHNEINIVGRLNGKSYFFNMRNGPYDFPCRICKGIPTQWSHLILVNLSKQPHITPANVDEKLSLYLLFS